MTKPSEAAGERLLIFTLAAINFIHIVDFMILMPLGPQLMRAFAITPAQFAFLVSAYAFAASASGFIGAFVIDRFDRKIALLSLFVGFAVATVLCGLAPTYSLLVVARSAAGAFGGILGGLVYAIVGDVFPVERRGRATGMIMAGFSLASIAGVPIALFFANHFDWRMPFLLIGGVSVVILAVALKTLPSIRGHMTAGGAMKARQVLPQIFGKATHIWAFAFMTCLIMSGFTVIPFISPYLVSNAGLAEADLPYVYLVGGAFTIVTSRLFGQATDRYGRFNVFIVLALIAFIPVLLITHLPPSPFPVIIGVSALLTVFLSGRFVPAMAIITSVVETRIRGSFMSINSSVMQMGSGTASMLAGAIVVDDGTGKLKNYDIVGYIAVLAGLVAIILAMRLKRDAEQKAAATAAATAPA